MAIIEQEKSYYKVTSYGKFLYQSKLYSEAFIFKTAYEMGTRELGAAPEAPDLLPSEQQSRDHPKGKDPKPVPDQK